MTTGAIAESRSDAGFDTATLASALNGLGSSCHRMLGGLG